MDVATELVVEVGEADTVGVGKSVPVAVGIAVAAAGTVGVKARVNAGAMEASGCVACRPQPPSIVRTSATPKPVRAQPLYRILTVPCFVPQNRRVGF